MSLRGTAAAPLEEEASGRQFYLGKGNGPDDEAGYAAALAKWQAILAEQQPSQPVEQVEHVLPAAPAASAKPLSDLRSEFEAEQQLRYERGVKMPNAPRKQTICAEVDLHLQLLVRRCVQLH